MSRPIAAVVGLACAVMSGCGPGVSHVDAAADAVDLDAYAGPKRVFVSSTAWSGAMGGISGADQKCQSLADAEELGGSWIAWMSSTSADAIDRLTDDGPWELVTGQLVFATKAAIVDPLTGPAAGIGRDETGAFLEPTEEYAWTGTGATGVHAPGATTNCMAWTATAGEAGIAGAIGSTEPDDWTSVGQTPCGDFNHLICFEQ